MLTWGRLAPIHSRCVRFSSSSSSGRIVLAVNSRLLTLSLTVLPGPRSEGRYRSKHLWRCWWWLVQRGLSECKDGSRLRDRRHDAKVSQWAGPFGRMIGPNRHLQRPNLDVSVSVQVGDGSVSLVPTNRSISRPPGFCPPGVLVCRLLNSIVAQHH